MNTLSLSKNFGTTSKILATSLTPLLIKCLPKSFFETVKPSYFESLLQLLIGSKPHGLMIGIFLRIKESSLKNYFPIVYISINNFCS